MKLKKCIFTLVVMLSGFSATVFAEGIVAKIGETEYETLQEAINAGADEIITLLADVTITGKTTIDKNITLDLNGHNISEEVTDQFGAIYVKKGVTLTIKASNGGEITTDGGVVIGNYGTVIVEGGTINAADDPETDVSIYNFYYQADYYGTMTINDGTVARIWNCGIATLAGGTIVDVDNSGEMGIAEDATVTNIILRDGADAPEVPNTGKLTGAASLRVTMEDGFKAVYDNGIWTATTTTEPTGTVAHIGETYYYKSLAVALGAAQAEETVTLVSDIAASEIITIDKAITLDGGSNTLTSTAGRAINVSGANGVKIQNLTIDAKGERAINIIQNATNVTIDNVTATAANYTVNVASSAPNAVVTITNSYLTGLNVVNVGSAGAQVTINGGTITCNDQSATEKYAALAMNIDAKNAKITAEDVEIIINGDSNIAANGAEGGTITVGDQAVENQVAMIEYPGPYYYSFATLQGAIDYAKAGETVKLIRDVTASEIITINKAITLDGNDKTLTSTAGRAINIETEETVTISNLNIAAKERAINIINKAATVGLTNVTAVADNNAVMIATSAGSVNLTVNECDFTGLAVINVAGAGSQVAINATILKNVDANENENYGAITVSATAQGAYVTVTGGEIIVADDSKKAYVFPSDVEVTGVDQVDYVVATIGDAGFETLGDAIEYAKAGSTITLTRDVEASEIITINKAITLDGNGKKLTATGCEFPIVVSQSAEVNFVNCNLAYTREFAAVDTWYALYVPFAIELTNEFLTKYDVAEFSKMTTESMTITMVEESTLAANTPYFILVKDEASKTLEITVDDAEFEASSTNLGNVATLNGVYTETVASSIDGAYAMSSGAFKQAADPTQTLKPFRFYLKFNEPSQAAALRTISINVDGEEGTTAIDSSIFTNGETVVYDLQGRRVENPAKGIYIVNGKKVVIK